MPRLRRLLSACLVLAVLPACRTSNAPPAAAPGVDAALVSGTNAAVGQMGRYDFQAAVDAFRALASSHPDSAETSFNLAIALINRQRAEDAADADQRLRAIEAHPAVGLRARYARGLLLLYQGRDAEAFPLLSGVAAAAPRDAFPAYFAGQARLATAPAEALTWFDKARALDPLLRSAHYGAFQALQRAGRAAEAATALAAFEALDTDPRARLAEFKYTRMGPLAEAVFVDAPATAAAPPAGPRFAAPVVLQTGLATNGVTLPSLTVVDLDGDGTLDLFVAGAGVSATPNLVLRGDAGTWRPATSHPLAAVPDVRAALWGDIDNDGRTDAVLLRGGGRTQVWRQTAPGAWRDITAASRVATTGIDAIDGALFDADHDGDLDIWLANARGRNELLNNNGNGSFRRLASDIGLAGDGLASTAVAVADLDGDRDHDLVVLNATPPHEVYLNDRVWQYRAAPGFEAFRAATLSAVLAADLDSNGRPELYTTGPRGLEQWAADATGAFVPRLLAPLPATPQPHLGVADTNGDGALELVVSTGESWTAFDVRATGPAERVADGGSSVITWTLAALDAARGPSVVGLTADGALTIWGPGSGRSAYVALAPTGRSQMSDQRRSNVSGIGTKVAVRAGSRWTAYDTVRPQSGPGQSLQPLPIGLGGATRADLVSLVWSDGILQSELNVEAGRVQAIEETQRQLSSCPVLFAFNGSETRFVTDILGVGGIGFFEQPGVYSPPYPQESVLLPDGALGVSGGRHRVVIGEPMEEVAYFDQFALVAYDLPPGVRMALDERKAIASAPPTGAPLFFRDERLPVRASNDRGDDVTARITHADLDAAPPGPPDTRFIGMTARHTLEVSFAAPIDRGPGRPVLLLDGWVEYPYAQTVFAAWQAGAPYAAPTLEAGDGRGRWSVVAPDFGYPAGMPRQMSLPLSRLPAGTTALRLSTTQEIYWDRVAVAFVSEAPEVVAHELPLVSAALAESGFARRTTGPQRTPFYHYDQRAPLWDTRHPRGYYTRFGDVRALVGDADDAVAVIGPGEEVAVEFTALTAPPPRGWTRRYVLRSRGWCKDMDLYTKDGDTVEPLPGRATPARERLHAAFNTRFESGR